MEEVPDRQTVSIDFNYYLSRFYCLKALEVLRGHTAGEAARVGIPLDESLEFMVGRPDGDLERALNEIREKREKLSPMVDAGGIDAIPKLKEILQQGLARQREKETSELIAAPLDDGKVQGFLRNVIREWRQAPSSGRLYGGMGISYQRGGTGKVRFLRLQRDGPEGRVCSEKPRPCVRLG